MKAVIFLSLICALQFPCFVFSSSEHLQNIFCDSPLLLVIDVVKKGQVIKPPPGSFDFPLRTLYDIKVKQVIQNQVGFDSDAANHELIVISGGNTPCSPSVSIEEGRQYIIKGSLGSSNNMVSLHPCDYRDFWQSITKPWKKWLKKSKSMKRDCKCQICGDGSECDANIKKQCIFDDEASNSDCFKTSAICKKKGKKCKWIFTNSDNC